MYTYKVNYSEPINLCNIDSFSRKDLENIKDNIERAEFFESGRQRTREILD